MSSVKVPLLTAFCSSVFTPHLWSNYRQCMMRKLMMANHTDIFMLTKALCNTGHELRNNWKTFSEKRCHGGDRRQNQGILSYRRNRAKPRPTRETRGEDGIYFGEAIGDLRTSVNVINCAKYRCFV